MIRILAACLALALSACNTLSAVGNSEAPIDISCSGKFQISVVGSAAAFSGVNGSITGDCGSGARYTRTNGTAQPTTVKVTP